MANPTSPSQPGKAGIPPAQAPQPEKSPAAAPAVSPTAKPTVTGPAAPQPGAPQQKPGQTTPQKK